MLQLTQKLKNGDMRVSEVPWPVPGNGMVLVRNHYSLISAGTEGSTAKAARKSLVGKAKERPQQVKQVIDVLKQQGPVQAYRAVMKKLDAFSPLGYSCVGEVVEVTPDVADFQVGDFVACGGNTASHAEVVAVPRNLCVQIKLNPEAEPERQLKMAAYNTLGAIALQGVRQADMRLGETCSVIGLGLLGQLSCLLLRASGVKVVGLDIDQSAVDRAREHGAADLAFVQSETGVKESIESLTNGLGCDAVIITAATNSLGPISFAGEIARKKGRIVISGAVPTGFDREPHYYRKELELRMSCSYGPGRYDINYEDKGIDYPPAYVRWTENRNMQAFQELIRTGKINPDFLTTHEFSLAEAPKAYDMIVNRSEPFLGILIKYDVAKPLIREKVVVTPAKSAGKIGLAFIGAGSYAQGNLLPNIPQDTIIARKGVMTSSGTTSKRVAEKFGFEFCTSNENDIFENEGINTVFIATRHDSHTEYVIKALKAGKHVFVEKPLALTSEELAQIEEVYSVLSTQSSVLPLLMVGFNRRFSPLAAFLKGKMGAGPMSMIYRVNAGAVPADSWIQDLEIGGGRVVGEVCHFIDFLVFMCGSLPTRLYAGAVEDPRGSHDTVNINLEFENGSIGAVSYFANGSKTLPKEYVEVYRAGVTGVLRDFRVAEFYGKGKPERKKLVSQDKGQKRMVREFLGAIRNGESPLISPAELFSVSRSTFRVLESLRRRESLVVESR